MKLNCAYCQQGRHDCTCVQPDLPANRWTLLVAIVAVLGACYVSSFFPMGFAP